MDLVGGSGTGGSVDVALPQGVVAPLQSTLMSFTGGRESINVDGGTYHKPADGEALLGAPCSSPSSSGPSIANSTGLGRRNFTWNGKMRSTR